MKATTDLLEKILYMIILVGNFFLVKQILQITINTLGIDDYYLTGFFLLILFITPFIATECIFYYLKSKRRQGSDKR